MLVNTDNFSIIVAIDPADRALCNLAAQNFRGKTIAKFNKELATLADQETLVFNAAVHTRFRLGTDEFDFWLGTLQNNLDLEDFPEGATQAQLDAYHAATPSNQIRYHRIQMENGLDENGDPNNSPLTGQLVNKDGSGPWNAFDHWREEINELGFQERQDPPPPPDRWVVTREQLDALDPAISKAALVNAVFPEYL